MPLIDFAIVTALLEEFEIIRKVLPPLSKISENSQVWYRTKVRSKDKLRQYHVVIAFQKEMGPLDAQALTKSLINRWNPAYIILAGIAGSFHENVKLGDVIISQQIFYYDLGKAVSADEQIKIKYRPQGYPCSITLIRQSEAVSVDEKGWENIAKKSAKKKADKLPKIKDNLNNIAALESHSPRVHFGTVASGSLVITSPEKKQELLNLHGKIIGTEMEGAGVLHATYYEEVPIPAIVIKGVSDAADNNKGILDNEGYWREIACENAARFVLQLMHFGNFRPLNTDKFLLSPVSGPPTQARIKIKDPVSPGNSSFLAFPQLINPQGPLIDILIEVVATGNDGLLKIQKLVAEYVDKENQPQTKEAQGNMFKASEVIYSTIGIYILVFGEAKSVKFNVKTFGMEQQGEWLATR